MSDADRDKEVWDTSVDVVTKVMNRMTRPVITPLASSSGTHVRLEGTGTYICVENSIYLLTCRHVAIRNADDFLLYGLDQPFKLENQYRLPETALDCALLPIPALLWMDNEHSAAAVQLDPFIAQKYERNPNELYYFHGFAGENANYAFKVHETNPTGYTTQVNQEFPMNRTFSTCCGTRERRVLPRT